MALYHSARGSVNYTIVGSPTIVDGVVSGFSSSDYLTLPTTIDLNQDFEICIAFKLTSNLEIEYTNLFSYRLGATQGFQLINWDTNVLRANSPFNATAGSLQVSPTGGTFQQNVNYKAIWKRIGNTGYLDLYADGTLVSSATKEYTTSEDTMSEFVIGVRAYNHIDPFSVGSIDLNETYIKGDGQPWFGVCPVEVKKHQLMGPVGYTKVGSPTIVDGVASGFSADDFLRSSQAVAQGAAKTYEISTKFTTPSTFEHAADMIGFYNAYTYGLLFEAGYNNQNFTLAGQCRSGGAYYRVSTPRGYLQPLTTYYAKLIVDGELGTLTLKISTDNQNWDEYTAEYTVGVYNSDSVIVWDFGYGAYGAFNGSIDLNETYIKVNGKLWFYQPAPTKYIIHEDKDTHEQKLVFADQGLYLAGPVNYTVVGTPLINDGIASCPTSSDSIKTTYALTYTSNSNIEFYVRFKTPTTFPDGFSILLNNTTWGARQFYAYTNWIYFRLPSDTVYLLIKNLSTDTWYRAKVTGNNNTWTMVLYDDNGTQIDSNTVSDSSVATVSGVEEFVSYRNTTEAPFPYIDLKETYIKVDGSLWFYGKNYATQNIAPVPAGYTYGNTTTSAIGWVDMRTQQFKAAPSGATIGRDE